jgi:hypothetical protein
LTRNYICIKLFIKPTVRLFAPASEQIRQDILKVDESIADSQTVNLINRLIQRSGNNMSADILASATPILNSLESNLAFDYDSNVINDEWKLSAQSLISESLAELSNITIGSIETAFNAFISEADSQIERLTSAVNRELQLVQARSGEIEQKLKRLDSDIKRRESIADRVFLGLNAAVYGFMVLSFLTLVSLRVTHPKWLPRPMATLLIKERTAVELVTTVLLLVTILFLGTGGFIEKSTVATLLGTIAGYLLNRSSSCLRREGESALTSEPSESLPDSQSPPRVNT